MLETFLDRRNERALLKQSNESLVRRQSNCKDSRKLYYMYMYYICLLVCYTLLVWINQGGRARKTCRELMEQESIYLGLLCRCNDSTSCKTAFDLTTIHQERKEMEPITWLILERPLSIYSVLSRSVYTTWQLTIDEMLLAFKGRCLFRRYTPSKPVQYDIKIQLFVDPKSVYISNWEVYAVKQPAGLLAFHNSTVTVAKVIVPGNSMFCF